jgi:hypothetical protein
MGLPPISNLVKSQNGVIDKTDCYLFIEGLIIMLNEFFGVTWSNGQIEQLSKELYSEYYYWTIADWKLFCKKAHKCEFDEKGKIFGSWSPHLMMAWAEKYDSDWTEVSSDIAIHNHELEKKREERSADLTKKHWRSSRNRITNV